MKIFLHRPLLIVVLIASSLEAVSAGQSTIDTNADLVASINPQTGAVRAAARYRYIYGNDTSPIWNGVYTQAGIQMIANPAFVQIGGQIEWMPVTVFQIRAQYDVINHLGNQGSLLDFNTPDDPFGDDVLKARKNTELRGTTNRYSLHPTLRAKFGQFVFINSFDYYFYRISVDRPYFLERALDILVAKDGRIVADKLNALYSLNLDWAEQTLFGPIYEITHSDETNLTRQRLGLNLLQSFNIASNSTRHFRWFSQIAYNLQDRNRAREWYFALGIGADISI